MLFAVNALDLPIKWDEIAYTTHAATILRDPTRYTDVFRPPLYPAFVAASWYTFGMSRFSVGVMQALISTVSIALVYRLARRRFARRAIALVAAFLCAIYLEFITLTRLYLTETLFIACALGGFVLLIETARRPRARTAFAAGIVWCISALTREVVIYFGLIVVPLWMLLTLGWRRALRVIGAFALGVILIMVPWITRNYTLEGRFILIGNSGDYTLLRDNVRAERILFPETKGKGSSKRQSRMELRAVPPNERTRYIFTRVAQIVARAPTAWLALRARNVRQFWAALSLGDRTIRLKLGDSPGEMVLRHVLMLVPLGLMLLVVVGMFAAPDDAYKLLIVCLVLYTLAIVLLTHYQPRFRVPLLAFTLPDAAFGIVWLIARARQPRLTGSSVRNARVLLGALVLALFVALMWQTSS